MKNLFIIALLLLPLPARAATFERVQEALVGWHYTYQASSNGYQVPVYFTLRQCKKTGVADALLSQGYSPIAQCFENEGAARIAAQKWADSEELRYRDVQDPTPAPLKAIKKLWQKVKGQ